MSANPNLPDRDGAQIQMPDEPLTKPALREDGWAEKFDRWNQNWADLLLFVVRFILAPVLALPLYLGWLTWVAVSKVVEFFRRGFTAGQQRGLMPKRNPFSFKRYGDSGLNETNERTFSLGAVVLVMIGIFELFSWSSLWFVSGVWWFWAIVLSCLFALLVVSMDFVILSMDDDAKGWSRYGAIGLRLILLLGIAVVNSVPAELVVFAPEINRVIADQEAEQLDIIRAAARQEEIGLITSRNLSTNETVRGQTNDLTSQRSQAREQLLAQQAQARSGIEARIRGLNNQLNDEIAGRAGSFKAGNGVTAISLRDQLERTRAELASFNQSAGVELAAFDAGTETIRSGTAQQGQAELARREADLDSKLAAIQTMHPDDLTQRYGGSYKKPDGLLARFVVLEELLATPYPGYRVTPYQRIVWGIRIVMIFFGLGVLLMKLFAFSAVEVKMYLSAAAQAMISNPAALGAMLVSARAGHPKAFEVIGIMAVEGNPAALETVRHRARGGDQRAISILRKLRKDPENAAILQGLGYSVDMESLGWSDEVVQLHRALHQARVDFVTDFDRFHLRFRELCTETEAVNDGFGGKEYVGLTRQRLCDRAERLWKYEMERSTAALTAVEVAMRPSGVRMPEWDLPQPDPRLDHAGGRLWMHDDQVLESTFGWVNPSKQARTVATA